VFAALKQLGVRTWPSAANFVLMDIGAKHSELVNAMRAHGVLLRDRSSDPGCAGYVRITIGVEEQMTRGIAALRASLAEIGWTPAESVSAKGRSEGEREYE
jgi:histidinol-phosphate aminotransferase